MTNTLGVDVTTKLNFGLFSIKATHHYTRSIRDTDTSFSINYYHLVEREVSLKFDSAGVLNDNGNKIYQSGKNNLFRVTCGDQIITSYKQRASLLFAFHL